MTVFNYSRVVGIRSGPSHISFMLPALSAVLAFCAPLLFSFAVHFMVTGFLRSHIIGFCQVVSFVSL